MRVLKIYNNNIIAVIGEHQQVALVTGKGIGFHAHVNDELTPNEQWRIFELADPKMGPYRQILDRLNPDAFEISQEIYDLAQSTLDDPINPLLVIVLADHIAFKLALLKDGVQVPNLLSAEIRSFYPREFAVGRQAVALIEKRFAADLGDDEAAYLAMHIINMMSGAQPNSVFVVSEFIRTVVDLSKQLFQLDDGEDTWLFERLIIHVKYLAQRLSQVDPPKTRSIPEADPLIRLSIPEGIEKQLNKLLERTDQLAQKMFSRNLSREEKMYLSIHILRIIEEKRGFYEETME